MNAHTRERDRIALEVRDAKATSVTHMHVERDANGLVAVVWVATPTRVLELRELLDEDGLLPEHIADTQAFAVGFVDRATGARVPLPPKTRSPEAGRAFMEWCSWTSRAHDRIDRNGRKAVAALQKAEATATRISNPVLAPPPRTATI